MTVAYATLRDVYDLGLSARSFVVVPRPLDPRAGDSLDPATGTFWLLGHGLATDDVVWFVLIASGGVGALPGGASAIVPYAPLPIDARRFQLSTTFGGSPVTFTNVGSSATNSATSWGILVDPERRLQRIILDEAADIDQCLTAHSTPLVVDPVTGKFPQKAVGMNARYAARRAIAGNLFENAATKIPTERLDAAKKDDDAQKEAWRLGQPIYPTPKDQTDGVPDNGARAMGRGSVMAGSGCHGCSTPPICWVRGSL